MTTSSLLHSHSAFSLPDFLLAATPPCAVRDSSICHLPTTETPIPYSSGNGATLSGSHHRLPLLLLSFSWSYLLLKRRLPRRNLPIPPLPSPAFETSTYGTSFFTRRHRHLSFLFSSDRRNMSSFAGYRSLAPKTKNLIVAGGLTGFVLGVYYYTMRAVGGTDELQVAIDKFEELKKKEDEVPPSSRPS